MRNYDMTDCVCWAIQESWLHRLSSRSAVGILEPVNWLTYHEIEARQGGVAKVNGTVVVLPVHGMISQRSSIWHEIFGGTSTDRLGAQFDAAMASDQVKGIVLDIDSPGGTTYGVAELADKIFAARGVKPVIAVANSLMASAAYWIGSAADKLMVSPGGDVGSIGVYLLHQDVSGALDADGVKMTLVSAGKYKVEANPFEPLSEDARQALQDSVDATYGDFVAAVARHRGVSSTTVRNGFGQGRVVRAKEAVAEGMADRVASLNKVLTEMGVQRTASTRAEAEEPVQNCGDPDVLRRKLKLRERELCGSEVQKN